MMIPIIVGRETQNRYTDPAPASSHAADFEDLTPQLFVRVRVLFRVVVLVFFREEEDGSVGFFTFKVSMMRLVSVQSFL